MSDFPIFIYSTNRPYNELVFVLRGIFPIKWVKSNESINIGTLSCLYDLVPRSKNALPSVFQPDFLDLSTSKILKLYRRFGSWSFVGRRGRDRDEGGTDSR